MTEFPASNTTVDFGDGALSAIHQKVRRIMRGTAIAVLILAIGFLVFCAHQAGSEIMIDDPDFAEFTVYNSVTHQRPMATMTVLPERGDKLVVRLRTLRQCSPVLEVVLHGHVVGDVASVYRRGFGRVAADTTIEFSWDLCWSPEIVSDIELMDVSKFHKGTMWLDDEGRFLIMPLILERPDLYPVEEGQFLPDPYDYSKVFNTYRDCENGGVVVLGTYFICIHTEEEANPHDNSSRLGRARSDYRSGRHLREGYGHLRWRYVSIWSEDPSYTPRKWPKRESPSVEELRGD